MAYYKALTPKLIAREFEVDKPRDYELAFDELFGGNQELQGVDLDELLREL